MPKAKLTEAAVERVRPPQTGRLELWDTIVPGFGLRVSDRGTRAFFCMARVNGALKRWTVGRYPIIGVADARSRARAILDSAAQGVDLRAEQQRLADQQRRAETDTVSRVIDRYAEMYLRRRGLRSGDEAAAALRREFGRRYGDRPISEVTRRDIRTMVEDVAGRAPVAANRLLANVRRLFAWAAEQEIVDSNPVTGIRPPTSERPRDRVLIDSEIASIWAACDHAGWPGGPIVKLLLCTGGRRNEIAHARWSEIDLAARTLIVPPERFKSGRHHVVFLNDVAAETLESCPAVGTSGLIFPSSVDSAFLGFAIMKRNVDRFSGVDGWKLHDLRRTVASKLAELGVGAEVLTRVLGHATRGGVLGVYDRYSRDREARAALDAWGRELERIIGRGERKVVTLAGER